MQKTKFYKAEVTQKKDKKFVKVYLTDIDVTKEMQSFDTESTKKSNQPMNRQLDDAWQMLTPHLLWGSEMTDRSIILDENIDERKWFKEFGFNEEERFQGVEVTRVDFIGNNGIIDSVKLYGHRTTQLTDKPFKVKIETPVINFDRTAENAYPLVVILEEQITDVIDGLTAWYEKLATLTKAQASLFITDKAS